MQKRLDLALNRSNRERDTAETARDDKVTTLEATQVQILSQSFPDANRFWWDLYQS